MIASAFRVGARPLQAPQLELPWIFHCKSPVVRIVPRYKVRLCLNRIPRAELKEGNGVARAEVVDNGESNDKRAAASLAALEMLKSSSPNIFCSCRSCCCATATVTSVTASAQVQKKVIIPLAAAAMSEDFSPSIPPNSDTPINFFAPRRGSSSGKLEGKVALVTGGARGIGEAIVRLFVAEGAHVIIADLDEARGSALAAELGSLCATFTRCDVTCEADVERAVSSSSSLSSVHGLDVLVNNAAILGDQQRRKSLTELDAGNLDAVLRVNVVGSALAMKHAARAMVPRRGGCIVSVASVAAVAGGLGPHAYTASKHALLGLTRSAACELGPHGIRVNAVSPFGVATRMLVNAWRHGDGDGDGDGDRDPTSQEVADIEGMVRRLGNLKGVTLKAEDVAQAVLFLASDDARYISGHNLVVDGGTTVVYNCIGL